MYYRFINGIVEYRFEFNSEFDKSEYGHVAYANDSKTTIPKNLIFIWIGKTIPIWMKNSIDAYSKVNPEFNIIVEHIEDLSNTKNKYVLELKDILNSPNDSWQFFKKFHRSKFSKMLLNSKKDIDNAVEFSDMLRFYILNAIGGIYVDADTFPNKPFDEQLLKKNFFVRYYNPISNEMWEDIFFIGMKPKTICVDDNPATDDQSNNFSIYHIFKSPYFDYNCIRNKTLLKNENKELFEKFYAGKLEYDEKIIGHTSYIMHFNNRSWSIEVLPIEKQHKFF